MGVRLIDLMEIYRITDHKPTVNDYVIDILNEAHVDARIKRDIMSMRILAECGGRLVRYNTTDTFKTFAVAWFEAHNDNITKAIDLLTLQYSVLEEYAETKREDIDRSHITDGTKNESVGDTKNVTIGKQTATTTGNQKAATTSDTTATTTGNMKTGVADVTKSSTLNATIGESNTITDSANKGDSATDEHFVSAENESGVQLRNRDTHSETITDGNTRGESKNKTNAEMSSNTEHEETSNTENETQNVTASGSENVTENGTENTTENGTQSTTDNKTLSDATHEATTHDDSILTTVSGHKTAPAELIRAELELAKLNIYDQVIEDFADDMLLNVF